MILVDSRTGSASLLSKIRALGVTAELSQLEFGDACFEGHGPRGYVCIGIERKTLADMLNCIDDARYSSHQLPGMARMYDRSILNIEGVWGVGSPPFMQGLLITSRGDTWFPLTYRTKRVMYSKLYRYLLSVALSGVIITYSRDLNHTAYNICECFHYFQKRWDDHTAMQETQKLMIPDIGGRISLVRRWAAQLTGVGVKHSMDAEKIFRTAADMAKADEEQWMRIPGLGVKTAQGIVREIYGRH